LSDDGDDERTRQQRAASSRLGRFGFFVAIRRSIAPCESCD
jgi:hypothetical protein